jgi:hypothetical protein
MGHSDLTRLQASFDAAHGQDNLNHPRVKPSSRDMTKIAQPVLAICSANVFICASVVHGFMCNSVLTFISAVSIPYM